MTLSKWLLIFAIGVAFLAAANEASSATTATATTPTANEASSATTATAVADGPSIHKSCKACVAARSTFFCFWNCSYYAWCDKGEASECMDEDECIGHTAITESYECTPTEGVAPTTTATTPTTSTTATIAASSAATIAAVATTPIADGAGDHKSCTACVAARSGYWCFFNCNKNAWCDKGAASECVHETQCTGYTAITELDKCLPTSCPACMDASDMRFLTWCDQGTKSLCTATNNCGEKRVTVKSACLPTTCTACLAAEGNTWCDNGMKSLCTRMTECEAGFQKITRAQSSQCVTSNTCSQCVATSIQGQTLTWCEGGRASVCIRTGTCDDGFYPVTEASSCLPNSCTDCLALTFGSRTLWCTDRSACAWKSYGGCGEGTSVGITNKIFGCKDCRECLWNENGNRNTTTWCESNLGRGSVCRYTFSDAETTCGAGFNPNQDRNRC